MISSPRRSSRESSPDIRSAVRNRSPSVESHSRTVVCNPSIARSAICVAEISSAIVARSDDSSRRGTASSGGSGSGSSRWSTKQYRHQAFNQQSEKWFSLTWPPPVSSWFRRFQTWRASCADAAAVSRHARRSGRPRAHPPAFSECDVAAAHLHQRIGLEFEHQRVADSRSISRFNGNISS